MLLAGRWRQQTLAFAYASTTTLRAARHYLAAKGILHRNSARAGTFHLLRHRRLLYHRISTASPLLPARQDCEKGMGDMWPDL